MNRFTTTGIAGILALALASPAAAAEQPATYATPQDAFEAFDAALSLGEDALLEVFGTASRDILSTGNPDRDAQNNDGVRALMEQGYRFQGQEDGSVLLLLGPEGWPFPIPLARSGDAWAFDLEAGSEEVYYRRIGLNELDAIEMMRAYVIIQSEYRLVDHDGDGVMEFADAFLSSEGQRDGLVWAEDDSPLGVLVALASLDGYNDGSADQEPQPFGGYYFRILQGQGPDAPGGAMDYAQGGNMVAGHALLAVPSDYGESGIHSFLVSENGIVWEADLGEDSLDIGFDMTRYNPGEGWQISD